MREDCAMVLAAQHKNFAGVQTNDETLGAAAVIGEVASKHLIAEPAPVAEEAAGAANAPFAHGGLYVLGGGDVAQLERAMTQRKVNRDSLVVNLHAQRGEVQCRYAQAN